MLNENHVEVLVYNILNALKFFHSTGLMHRDIKQANILIDQGCDVKLCDFGSARPILSLSGSEAKRIKALKSINLEPKDALPSLNLPMIIKSREELRIEQFK